MGKVTQHRNRAADWSREGARPASGQNPGDTELVDSAAMFCRYPTFLALSLSLLLAACSGDDTGGTSGGETTGDSTPATTGGDGRETSGETAGSEDTGTTDGIGDTGTTDGGETGDTTGDATTGDATTGDGTTGDGTTGDGTTDGSVDHPACSAQNPWGEPFDMDASGSGPMEKVGDFTLPTLDGDWNLADAWTGCDTVLFIAMSPGSQYQYAQAIWDTPFEDLLKATPTNVHFVFMSYDAGAATEHVTALKAKADAALGGMAQALQDHWADRLHFMTTGAFQAPGWVGPTLMEKGVFWFGIDRFQRRREVGLMNFPGGNPSSVNLTYEANAWNFEWDREQWLDSMNEHTEVTVWDTQVVQSGWGYTKIFGDVTLPDAAEMSGFDTMLLDLALGCDGPDEGSCPDWDREVNMYVCELALADNIDAETACQPQVKDDEGNETTPADTLACECAGPLGTNVERTQTCNAEGTGYSDCGCGCGHEFARQITTYKRQGRWVTDVSELLPLLARGGAQRFAYVTVDKYVLTARLLLSNQGKEKRPTSIVQLYTTKQFNETYNDNFEPLTVAVPKSATGAKIVSLMSGHGSGTDSQNCAEFCPHSHHFQVNGTEVVHTTEVAGTQWGCLNQIKDGTVPNQYGTWPFGRAGWCPGMDVKLFVADVSEAITPGQDATISYEGKLFGQDYAPEWTGGGDYKPVIKLNSWIVFEE
ncbi:MAG: hypothetical protein ACI9WU_002793 [Myxococcota bacterium]|jgi:hypothetical protein